jgi:hypothetical protein
LNSHTYPDWNPEILSTRTQRVNVLDWYWVSWNIVVATILILVDLIVVQAVLKMLSEIASVENIPDFIEGVKNRSEKS